MNTEVAAEGYNLKKRGKRKQQTFQVKRNTILSITPPWKQTKEAA